MDEEQNSGLINLDALMKEASQPELPKSDDDSLEPLPPVLEPPSPPQPSSSGPSSARRPWLTIGPILTLAAIGAFVVGMRRPKEVPTPRAASTAPRAAVATAAAVATGVPLADLPASKPSAALPSAPPAAPVVATPATPAAKLVAIADAPPKAAGDLGGAMREAVGPRSSADVAVVDPSPAGSARQLKPSPGAVVGAINSVMPAARECLASDDPIRSATVVFRSDGTVARVDLASPSRPTDECIRNALSKARTMPFVDDTFAARATVRP